jgi:hypothetical protein
MTMAETLITTPTISSEVTTPVAETTTLEANHLATQAGDWSAHVPKGSEKVFESYKGKPIGDVLKSFADAQSLIGGSIRLPKADALPADKEKALNDIYNKLGRPESPDKYDLGELPPLPENVKWDDAKLSDVKVELHKMGLTTDQAKAVLSLHAKELGQFVPDNTKVAAESKQSLLEHYGSEAMFSRNMNFAQKTLKEFGDAETIEGLDKTGLGNAPWFIKYQAKIGRELIEHGAIDPAAPTDALTTKDAQDQVNKIMNDKGDLYWAKKGTPGKDDRAKEVAELYKIIAGEI